jgi:hypothetical protein
MKGSGVRKLIKQEGNMKRIIVLALVILVFGILSDAGAYPSSGGTSNPRYKPGTGSGGGGVTGGTSLFSGIDGTITDDVAINSVLLGDITINAYMSNLTTDSYIINVPDNLSLPLDSQEHTYSWAVFLEGASTRVAQFKWNGGGSFSAAFSLNLDVPIGYDMKLTILFPFQTVYEGQTYALNIERELGPAPVPVPPSLLLLAPGLFGLIVVRRRWMK